MDDCERPLLVELDYKSFHAVTLGFEAQCAAYIRLARLDLHSYLTAHLVKFPKAEECIAWPDADLLLYLKDVRKRHKKVRERQAKVAGLGYGFGMGANTLYMRNREHFANRKEAQRVLNTLEALFPELKAYRDRIRKQAHQDGYLLSRHGSIRYFWEVYKYDREKGWVPGEDSEAAIAYLPANDAFGHMKDSMIRLDDMGALERYSLINQIHDALLFDSPPSLVDECIAVGARTMEERSTVLVDPVVAPEGLMVEVSASIGESWNAMREVPVPR